MKADELRALQAPIKDRYRADPGAALVRLRATGSLAAGVTRRRSRRRSPFRCVAARTIRNPTPLEVTIGR